MGFIETGTKNKVTGEECLGLGAATLDRGRRCEERVGGVGGGKEEITGKKYIGGKGAERTGLLY